jgi:hypothetical protein
MAEPELIHMPERIPEVVTVTQTSGVRFTPNELRVLKAETGKTMTQLMGPEADDADRMQTIAWLRLRRDGHAVKWEDCGDIAIDIEVAADDPTPTVS